MMLAVSNLAVRRLALALLSFNIGWASEGSLATRANAFGTALGNSISNSVNGLVNGILASYGIPGTTAGTKIQPVNQNGKSCWGMFCLSPLPLFKTGGGTTLNNGWPWGRIDTVNTNPYKGGPYTAVTRSYNFALAECDFAPDGVTTQKVLCINGQYPGPLIEANYGDMISVTVTNQLLDQGTTFHWHGFLQTGTNDQDGVPGVTQCPIAPGQSFTYTFRAELYGSTWYHTHYSAQYASGAVGPIVIYGPSQSSYDVDMGPVMLSEWYRNGFAYYIQKIMNPLARGGPTLPVASSNLINGKMRFPCDKTKSPCVTADYAKFNFTSGKNHRLRLMNTGAAAIQKFAIDGHNMRVISNDFMPIVPYNTSMVALGVGQRVDVIVYGSGKPNDLAWMRSNDVACSINDGTLTEALGVIYYEKSDHASLPTAGANQGPTASTSIRGCANDPLTKTVPAYPLAVDPNPVVGTFNITLKSNGTNLLFYFNQNSLKIDYSDAILAAPSVSDKLAQQPSLWFPEGTDFTNKATNASSVRVVLYNYDDAPHPIHMHGHNAQILNIGIGTWDGSIVRANNPTRRDVFVMPPGSESFPSYLVLQWPQDNPGVWPLHCHFAWHSSMGLVALVVERATDTIPLKAKYKNTFANTCTPWSEWLKKVGTLVTGIDSGLRARDNGELGEALEAGPNDGLPWPREVFPGSGIPNYSNESRTWTEKLLRDVDGDEWQKRWAEEGLAPEAESPKPYAPRFNEHGAEIF